MSAPVQTRETNIFPTPLTLLIKKIIQKRRERGEDGRIQAKDAQKCTRKLGVIMIMIKREKELNRITRMVPQTNNED